MAQSPRGTHRQARPRHGAQGGAPGEPRPHHRLRTPLVAVALAACVLAGTYGLGCLYFASHFALGTIVDGLDASGLTEAELASKVDAIASGWSATVTGGDIDLPLGAADIGLTADGSMRAATARAQVDPRRWPLGVLRPTQVQTGVGVSVDEALLGTVVGAAVDAANQGATPPTDASVAYDQGQGAFVIRDAALGTQVDVARAVDAVREGALRLSETIALGDDQLVQPGVRADDPTLMAARDQANQTLLAQIPLTKDGQELTRVTKDQTAMWVSVDPSRQVAVDEGAIVAWARDTLAGQVAKSDEVHDYALDAASLAATVAGRLRNVSSDAVEIPLVVTAERPAESEGARSRGRHIDLNLSTQYARLYDGDGSVIWRSYMVSGNTGQGHGTPTGEYSILAKQTNQTLIGADEDHDNKPDYKSHVNYWMPFIGNAVGLHDASWRSRFGGSIYRYGGSHGCVNLPSDKAAELFSLARVGDKVYVHR